MQLSKKKEQELLNRCYELAANSNCNKMNFGAVVINKKGFILGEGCNRIATGLKEYCYPCIREKITSGSHAEICSAIHAEQAAILDAFDGGDPSWIDRPYCVIVAGQFPDGREWLKKEAMFPCTLCSRVIWAAGIKEVWIPNIKREFYKMKIEDVLKTAMEYVIKEWRKK